MAMCPEKKVVNKAVAAINKIMVIIGCLDSCRNGMERTLGGSLGAAGACRGNLGSVFDQFLPRMQL